MPVDETSLLPDPPPPRPARRDAAIDAAMRRFDGIEDPQAAAAPSPGRRGFGGRPQFGALVTASLVVVVGLPAALIAIRNNQPSPPPAMEAPATDRPDSRAVATAEVADRSVEEPAAVPMPATGSATIRPPEPDRRLALSDQSDESLATAPAGVATSPPVQSVMAPAAPAPAPPPPAPPPSAAAERNETFAEDSAIVVTGGRIASPGPLSESIRDGRGRSQAVSQKSSEPAAAPKWVLDNGSYRGFLGQLQSAVRANDRSAVVKLVRLPLRVNFAGSSKTYRDTQSVLGDYDRIFTPRVRNAILAQRFETLFGRDQGVMIGDGAVWFDHVCRNQSCSPPGPVRIHAINP